jgi:hypothetical protein
LIDAPGASEVTVTRGQLAPEAESFMSFARVHPEVFQGEHS